MTETIDPHGRYQIYRKYEPEIYPNISEKSVNVTITWSVTHVYTIVEFGQVAMHLI